MPAWNTRDIEELSANALQWSTVVESRAKKHNTKSDKPCVFCCKTYGGGPQDIEIDLEFIGSQRRQDVPAKSGVGHSP